MTITPKQIDFHIRSDGGTLIGLQPLTEAAQDWVREHVQAEDRQWLGNVLWIDHRMATPILEHIRDEFEVA